MKLAKEYVHMYHGAQAAEEAEQHFITVFQKESFARRYRRNDSKH